MGWDLQVSDGVFPTPVGVFPTYASGLVVPVGLPHARGGVSQPALHF